MWIWGICPPSAPQGEIDSIIRDLKGVIYKNPEAGGGPLDGWETADEYLSGNVRKKLAAARAAAEIDPAFAENVAALEQAQPKDLSAAGDRRADGKALPGLTRSITPNLSMNS